MNLGLKSLEKLIKGQKRPKKAKETNKCHSRPSKAKTSKNFDFIISQCKIINILEWNNKKKWFFKSWNFHIHYIKSWNYILSKMLRFPRISGKTRNSAYSLVYFMNQKSFHPYISHSWSKNKKFEWSHYIGI